jgi:hypothetical protein
MTGGEIEITDSDGHTHAGIWRLKGRLLKVSSPAGFSSSTLTGGDPAARARQVLTDLVRDREPRRPGEERSFSRLAVAD